MKKISVIVPVYNQEKYLNVCVTSILSSTFTDFECILVDDGSKDLSSRMCDEWQQKDERIVVIHKENGGLTSARKAGFDIAQGEYICFVDSDDYIGTELLEKLISAIEDNQADVSVCGHFQVDNGSIKDNTFVYYDTIIEKEDMIRKYVLPVIGKIYAPGYINYPGYVWGRLYRKAVISEECFVSEREVYTEDDLFQMYLAPKASKVVFINDKLCYYRENAESLTHVYRKNMWSMLKKRHQRIVEFFEEYPEDKDEVRILGSAFYTIYVSITNAYGLHDKKKFIEEIKEIRQDEFSKIVIKSMNTKILRPRQLACFYLFKFRCYGALYDFRNVLFG